MANNRKGPDWQLVELGEVCSLRAEPVQPEQVPSSRYVGLEHIDSASARLARWGTGAEVSSTKSRFYVDDILYGKLRPYLDKAVVAEFEGICSTDILVFRPRDEVDSRFLAHLVHIQTFLEHAVRSTRGVNHPRVSWASLAPFEFRLPPLPEQRAIARVLRTVQQAKEARRREAALERERKAALMKHLLTHGAKPRRVAAQQTKFGSLPYDWKIRPLEQCAFVQTGVAVGRRLGDAPTVTRPYLRVANVQNGFLDLAEMKEITIRASEVERYALRDGDVVLTEGGDFDKLGRGFIWRGQVPNCVHQNHIFAVRADRSVLLPEFLTYLVQSEYGRAYFLSVAHKTTNLACINTAKLKALPAALPGLEEQREIVEALDACDAKIAAVDQEAVLLDELFRALLEELMTGRLSAVPLIETAVGGGP